MSNYNLAIGMSITSNKKRPLTHTSVTLKLNTALFKSGYTSGHDYMQILTQLAYLGKAKLHETVAFELDKFCQLHVHATLISYKVLYRNKIIKQLKEDKDNVLSDLGIKNISKYTCYLKPIGNNELKYWLRYCKKQPDMRNAYYEILRFYTHNECPEDDCLLNYDIVKVEREDKVTKFMYKPINLDNVQFID